ncbi:hypothetical protein V6R21_22160 [Limibacter armeniacum]|uniref:hypothetical protein n=1 Tax=Limibacter armeniacum TaxID=466084 RepID=UPI002FE66950
MNQFKTDFEIEKKETKGDYYQPNQNSSDEIDLVQLFHLIGKGLKRIGRGIVVFLIAFRAFLKQWYKGIGIGVLAGGLIGIGFQVYHSFGLTESTMVVKSEYLKGESFVNYINWLDGLCGSDTQKSKEMLANKLNIPVEQASQIKAIEAFSSTDFEELEKSVGANENLQFSIDTLKLNALVNEDMFAVRLKSGIENYSLGQIEQGIVSYVTSNGYVKKSLELSSNNLKSKKESIQKEINNLNVLQSSLQGVIADQADNSGQVDGTLMGGQYLMPMSSDKVKTSGETYLNVVKEKKELLEQLQEVELELVNLEPLQVVSGFTSKNASFKNDPYQLLIGAAIGGMVMVVLGLLVNLNKFLNRKEKEYIQYQ